MKKTTKILLVLAAVVAMTIGAVSTVMAADEFPTIASWTETKQGWTAVDTNGEDIIRGWAISEAGRWYFFDSGYMLVNTFVTYKEEIYYLDNTGCMAKGWIGFTKDTKVNTVDKYVKNSYANITLIEGFGDAFLVDYTDALGDDLITQPLVDKTTYATLWVYFDENGVMAQDEWKEAFGQWFYLTGPYCVLNDYHVAIDNVDTNVKMFNDATDGIYGFDKNGVMLVGWNYVDLGAYNGDKTDIDTPYEDLIGVKDATKFWTYYYTDGRQVNTKVATLPSTGAAGVFEGWEKIDGHWCYFIDDEILGQRLLQNVMLYDYDTDDNGLLDYNGNEGTFYLDKNGYMVTGVQSFAAKTTIPTWDEENTTAGSIKTHAAGTAYFFFSTATGEMLDGVIDKYYYIDNATADDYDQIFLVENADITTTGTITVDESTEYLITTGGYIDGQRINRNHNFFLVIDEDATVAVDFNGDGDKTDLLILYFEAGVWQKNQAITFGETTIGIDANGYVIGLDKTAGADDVTVAGLKYKFTDNTSFTLDGVGTIGGLTKK